jgi:glycerophosphoryl diester phosphodiesterase
MSNPFAGAATLAFAFVLASLSPTAHAERRHAHHADDGAPTPLVIGHRGASGYLPEHTLEGYALAVELGADFIEPDLVATKDGHLIARHEPNITNTTDVATRAEFASRRRTGVLVDGAAEDGWFAFDFTLAEIKTLRAKQAFAERPQQFNGRFEIPTFEEVIALAKRKSREVGRTIGVYPETKHPTLHQRLGLPLEGRLLHALTRAGWNYREAPVIIQSFEQKNLQDLRKRTRVRLVQLVDANDVNADGSLDYTAPFDRPYDWTVSGDPQLQSRTFGYFVTDAGLREVAGYADGIGPWKRYIVTTLADPEGTGPGEAALKLAPPNDLVERAHRAGLMVHTWTFRNEQRRLAGGRFPGNYGGDPVQELLQFFALGVDGVFSDFPDTAVAARALHRLRSDPQYASCLTREDRRDCD